MRPENKGRKDKKVIEKKPEPKRLSLKEKQEIHMVRHPNDKNKASGSIPGGVNWINLNKKANKHLIARYEQLEQFYETHEWVGQYPDAKWVKKENLPEVHETEEEE